MNQAIHTAIETARAKVAGQPAWTRSVEKAAQALLAGELIVTVLADNGGLVTSPRGTYHIRHGFCDCPATVNHCYHISALRIVALADEMPEASAAPVAAPAPRIPSRIIRSANWYGVRNGNAMWLNGWSV